MVRIIVLCAAGVALAAFAYFDLGAFLEIGYLKQQQAYLLEFVASEPGESAAIYFAVYLAVAALSLPGAAVLTLIGGALFGILWGTVLVSFASTLGATAAFLLSRYLFRSAVAKRFQARMAAIDKGMRKDGAWYLFTLRLVPVFPFFIVNLVMGLTAIKTLTFLAVSQVGMFPATLVFVNAGTQLAKINAPGDVLSPGLLLSFAALGLFPLAARKIVDAFKAGRVLKRFERPSRFDRNLIVIGAGSAGLVASYIAAAAQASVTLIEKHKMGGDCLNTGCVPSKALLRSAKIAHLARHGERYGLATMDVRPDFAAVMARIKRVITAIEPHDSIARYTALGVECISGEAQIVSPYRVKVGARELTTKHIIIAAGARPFVPPIPGLDAIGYLTSDTLWDLDELPPRLLVLGGGPIGCEIAQAFARLGSAVTQLEMLPRLLLREDEVVSAALHAALEADGIRIELNRRAVAFRADAGAKIVTCEALDNAAAATIDIEFDRVIVAVGRQANTQGYGLEELGITLNANGTVQTDEYLRTNFPNILACGDVAGPYQFTHTASHQAWYAAINSLFGRLKRFRVDYTVIPWCTFTDPEVARVGLNETEAQERGVAYELTSFAIEDLDRAIADSVDHGFVRVLTAAGTDRILGVSIVGEHAGDLITEFVLAMKHGLGLNKILGTIHIYPTLAESNKAVAGQWRRAHAPQWLLKLARRYHRLALRD